MSDAQHSLQPASEEVSTWTPEEWLNPDAGDVSVWRYRGPRGSFSCSSATQAVILGLEADLKAALRNRDRATFQLEEIARWFLESAPYDIDGRTFEVLMAAGRRKFEEAEKNA